MAWNSNNKYRNVRREVDGIVFDSRKEADRYIELKLLERAGEISNLKLQVPFVLIPTQREPSRYSKTGKEIKGKVIEKKCKYVADFVYERNGEIVAEDTKGVRTKDYIIKRKLMLYTKGIRVLEV